MFKIFISLLLFFTVLFGTDDNNETNNIVDITAQIQVINSQIKILKAQSDSNATSNASNLDTLEKKKINLISKIPFSIMQIDIKQSDLDKFKAQKKLLEKNVQRYEKLSDKSLFIQNSIDLERLKINESYYTTLINLEKLFKQGAKDSSIKELIDNGLLELQTNSYVSINDLKNSLTDSFSIYDSDFHQLELQKQTREEILDYLKTNASLLSSSLILSELNLQNAIDSVNKYIPLKFGNLNIGKVIIIAVVFIFFVSFTRILAKLTYWLISKLSTTQSDEEVREQVLEIVKKPITFLLIIYALSLCIAVGFYPAPVSINIVNIQSIVYIVGFTWLILTMLNGYGLILIGKIAKKSGRKEIVNLVLKITYFIVFIISFLMVLSHLGFDISALIASLGIGGLAVAFAAKDIIANFFASVMLLFDNSFSQGDWIVCGDIEGTVVEIGLRKTTIRTFDNALVFVPNSKLASDPIRNWNRRKVGRRITMTIGITYNSPIANIKKCIDDIRQMLIDHQGIAKPENMGSQSKNLRSFYRQNILSIDDLAGYKSNLFVVIDKLNDSSIDIMIYCFTKTTIWGEFLEVKQDVILKIIKIVEDNGLSFAFPSQTMYIEDATSTDAIAKLHGQTQAKDII
ncbi:mechanosensitive ion channel [Campylobacter sp. faydin G-24]|uniref:Mechanosensitive ion channel n=1 Tax=Campylobacter anatolicus TaxID=2829105 RepID=A0ABS5HJ72_9BACT|nr:mechanosensitive ion channel family protein [Campylobacter anatolicus]MBR8464177.1 mechanosensitive ion channel [Campylobacter anatolicus]